MADMSGMANPIATQLVQYSNDAVDVYYSDGSRLQLSACGTAFRYYHPPYAGQHPLHGQREIQQRTEFATSEFRPKVMDAVEFRNRFAECPFLCRGLLPTTNIVRLHADIAEVAWPCKVTAADVSVSPDGAVRLVSADEYAAVTMAPHRQYFTTEVLSRVSQRRQPRTSHNTTHISSSSDAMPSLVPSVAPLQNASRIATDDSVHSHPTMPFSSQVPTKSHSSTSCSPRTEHQLGGCGLSGASDFHREPSVEPEPEDKWEYVWMAQHHSVVDCPPCWRHTVGLLHDFIQVTPTAPSPGVSTKSKETQSSKPRGGTGHGEAPNVTQDTHCETKPVDYSVLQDQLAFLLKSSCTAITPAPECRLLGESVLSATERRAVTLQRLLKKDFAGCMFIAPPRSLPLSCPSLHLHRWRPNVITSDDNDRAEAAYMYGKVKVICVQGVIYKLVWCTPRSVEIYPGDGSIMRSTGLSGHFFTHYLHSPDQEAERTYSTQSPPPTTPRAPYSIAKLITRAARFLKHLCEESLHSLLNGDPCCWALIHGESEPVEPLATVVLEDSLVEAVGHFTAFSNGHVRILFTDRTSLDMVCDFNKRVLHGTDAETAKRYMKCPKPLGLSAGIVRLLLRTGHYHNVDITQPEPYEYYVEAALHWANWVNSSPTERGNFYKDTIYDQDRQRSIDSELKKIKCFNYIVDSVVKHPQKQTSTSNFRTDSGLPHCPSSATNPEYTARSCHMTGVGHMTKQLANQRMGSFNMFSIQDVLRQTAEAVADLDRFMKDAGRPEKS